KTLAFIPDFQHQTLPSTHMLTFDDGEKDEGQKKLKVDDSKDSKARLQHLEEV
ncbi:hypothetical protein PanWU01x14_320030, partial [Parasponia andersonii]